MWQQEVIAQTKAILRTYSSFKNDFFIEHHLQYIIDFRYRTAITKLRCSSHALEIEHGRYQNPKVPRDLCLCLMCKMVEDENHFVTKCSINQDEKMCTYLLIIIPPILTWSGKFVNQSFIVRNNIVLSWVTVIGISTVWSYVSMYTLEWSF